VSTEQEPSNEHRFDTDSECRSECVCRAAQRNYPCTRFYHLIFALGGCTQPRAIFFCFCLYAKRVDNTPHIGTLDMEGNAFDVEVLFSKLRAL